MSNVAILRNRTSSNAPFLGPATVLEVRSTREVTVRLPSGEAASAELALAYLYEPRPGDVMLVVGDEEQGRYAIGVLHGEGKARLSIPGDVELRAVGGKLRLVGDEGVEVEGSRVGVHAQVFDVVAGKLSQTVRALRQHVSELWSVRAGRTHTVVDDDVYQQSKSATVLTEEAVTINGKSIHLG